MIHAIIIDDEVTGVEVLRLMIETYCTNVSVSGVAYGVEEAVELINRLRPDLIFMDVELKNGSGFDILERLQHTCHEVIFTTAYDNYAIKAFKKRAVDYLLKPIDVEELKAAISVAVGRLKVSNQMVASLPSKEIRDETGTVTSKIGFPTSAGVVFLAPGDITYLRSESNYTGIYLNDKSKLLVSKTLKHVATCFSGYNFLRVHHSYMVNMNEVIRYIKGDGGTVVLKSGEKIPVSRAFKTAVMTNLNLL